MEYTLKEFAQMFGTTEHPVRYYTDIGLLPCSPQGVERRVRKPDAGHNLP